MEPRRGRERMRKNAISLFSTPLWQYFNTVQCSVWYLKGTSRTRFACDMTKLKTPQPEHTESSRIKQCSMCTWPCLNFDHFQTTSVLLNLENPQCAYWYAICVCCTESFGCFPLLPHSCQWVSCGHRADIFEAYDDGLIGEMMANRFVFSCHRRHFLLRVVQFFLLVRWQADGVRRRGVSRLAQDISICGQRIQLLEMVVGAQCCPSPVAAHAQERTSVHMEENFFKLSSLWGSWGEEWRNTVMKIVRHCSFLQCRRS